MGELSSVEVVADLFEVHYCLASLRSGQLMDAGASDLGRAELEGLAATLPDLFGTVDSNCLDRISERLGSDANGVSFDEILLLSDHRVHVVQRLGQRPGVALLAVSSAIHSIGLVLSAVRAHVAGLDAQ